MRSLSISRNNSRRNLLNISSSGTAARNAEVDGIALEAGHFTPRPSPGGVSRVRQKVEYYAQGYQESLALAQENQARLEQLYAEDLAAIKAGDAAKVRDVQEAMAQISAAIAQEVDTAKTDYQGELSAYKNMLFQQVDAQKAALEREQAMTQTFFSDLLTEHKTFGEEIKSIVNSWVKEYVDPMSKMLVPPLRASRAHKPRSMRRRSATSRSSTLSLTRRSTTKHARLRRIRSPARRRQPSITRPPDPSVGSGRA